MSRHGKHTERIATYGVEVPIMETRPTVDGYGVTSVAVGMKAFKVALLLDHDAAKQLAFRAASNRGRQAIDGALKAVVMEPRK